MAYKREYCCANCGLIWLEEYSMVHIVECPECHHSTKTTGDLYAVDTMGYAYAAKAIEQDLKKRGKEIHYSKNHPYYKEDK